jgi:4-amino-4-deoxy-L-arabinose transferase-like glycosyltransferase
MQSSSPGFPGGGGPLPSCRNHRKMTGSAPPAYRWREKCGAHWHFAYVVLAVLLVFGGIVRWHEIGREGQSADEFWSVYLSTGRGKTVFLLPAGKLLNPPPPATMEGAPGWWHIWSGMINAIHPPLYHIVLRWWMDLFGQGDRATRALSGFFSLAAAVVLCDAVRRTSGEVAGLIAAAVMIFAVSQIDFSQQTRSYTMLDFCGVLACHAVIRIERDGASAGKLFELGSAFGAGLLTHYLGVPAFAALGFYALVRFRGRDRRLAIAAMVGSTLFVLAIWYPSLREQFKLFRSPYGWANEISVVPHVTAWRMIYLPAAHLYGEVGWLGAAAPAAIVYVLPVVLMRQRPELLVWWFWVMGVMVPLGVRDAAHHTMMLSFAKYTFSASFAICALVAIPVMRGRWKWVVPGAMLASVMVASVQRWQAGPPPQGDWRGLALTIDRTAGENDPVVFAADPFWGSPAFSYLAMAHYAPVSHRPIMMLNAPADSAALEELDSYQKVWLVIPSSAVRDGWLPGWEQVWSTGRPQAGFLAEMQRVTSPLPTSQESR